jgi:F0F1-type ATP synthase assembly protein I
VVFEHARNEKAPGRRQAGRHVAEDMKDGSEPDPKDVERRKKELLAGARGETKDEGSGALAGVGVQFAVTILVCLFIGQWLDRKLGTTPWLLLSGVLLGAALGIWMMLRMARDAERKDADRRTKRGS